MVAVIGSKKFPEIFAMKVSSWLKFVFISNSTAETIIDENNVKNKNNIWSKCWGRRLTTFQGDFAIFRAIKKVHSVYVKTQVISMVFGESTLITVINGENDTIDNLMKNKVRLESLLKKGKDFILIINNDVFGVSTGWSKKLELVGTGFRAEVSGKTLSLTVGYSHPVKIDAPEGITFKIEKMIVTVDGFDKEIVGQIAADIRGARPPEPYKGKGIKYVDEIIRRKPGKAAAKTTGAA